MQFNVKKAVMGLTYCINMRRNLSLSFGWQIVLMKNKVVQNSNNIFWAACTFPEV